MRGTVRSSSLWIWNWKALMWKMSTCSLGSGVFPIGVFDSSAVSVSHSIAKCSSICQIEETGTATDLTKDLTHNDIIFTKSFRIWQVHPIRVQFSCMLLCFAFRKQSDRRRLLNLLDLNDIFIDLENSCFSFHLAIISLMSFPTK